MVSARSRLRTDVRSVLQGRTPAEIHWQSLGRRCDQCQGPPVVEVLIFTPAEEAAEKFPRIVAKIMQDHGGALPLVLLRGPDGGPRRFLPVLHAFACRHHSKELELLAARAPSYNFVDIRRGPDVARAVSAQV